MDRAWPWLGVELAYLGLVPETLFFGPFGCSHRNSKGRNSARHHKIAAASEERGGE